jgi:hypothetical protein
MILSDRQMAETLHFTFAALQPGTYGKGQKAVVGAKGRMHRSTEPAFRGKLPTR